MTRKPSPTRLKEELEQSNCFGSSIFNLLTTQHYAHGADLVRSYCLEKGQPFVFLKLTKAEVTDWLDANLTSTIDQLGNAARRVAIEVYFEFRDRILADPTFMPSRSPDDHADPFDYDWLAQEEEYRRDVFNAEFDPQHHQETL